MKLKYLAVALFWAMLPASMLPQEAAFDGLEVVSDEELAEQRGGFSWQGVQISLGAEIRTYLDGDLVLQTNVAWADGAETTTRMVSGALTPVDMAQLQAGILSSGGITMRVGTQSVYLANQGQTAMMHRTDGALQNVLINTANQVNARQEVDATLDLQNFQGFQQDILNTRLGSALADAIGEGTIGSLN
jgi:hypothetical protein